jgi:hypothetical protein
MARSGLKTICSGLLFAVAAIPAAGQQSQNPGLRDEVVAAEQAGLDALKRGDTAAFADSLAGEAIFVDAAGIASKAEVVQHVGDFHLSDYTMSGIQFTPLSASSGLIVYRIAESGASHGRDFTASAYISSIWAERSGKWVCLFSQETAAR